jgi:hypothetical protein
MILFGPKDSSLDFVKTISRLYYQQKDNSNLVKDGDSFRMDWRS